MEAPKKCETPIDYEQPLHGYRLPCIRVNLVVCIARRSATVTSCEPPISFPKPSALRRRH